MFLYCQAKKDNSYIDVWWGLSFIVPNALLMYLQFKNGTIIDKRTIITNALVALWGVRLAMHIGKRHTSEDYRYKDMRDRWMKKGTKTYYWYSFLYIFMM